MTYMFFVNKVKDKEYLLLRLHRPGKSIAVSTRIPVPAGKFCNKAHTFVRCKETVEAMFQFKKWQDVVEKKVEIADMIHADLEETRDEILKALGLIRTRSPKKEEIVYEKSLMESFKEYVETPTTRRKNNIHLKQSLRVFKEFLNGRNVTYEDMTVSFSEKWIQWMSERGLSPNTRGGHIKVLKAFLNYAYEDGLHHNIAYKKFRKEKEVTDAIYLNSSEIKMLAEANCRGMEEKARDMFLLGCYTGQRYSDCKTMKLEDMRDGYLYIIQMKTRAKVIVPVHPVVKSILEKWRGAPDISEQKENMAIKQLCRSLGMTQEIAIRKAGKVVYMQKWELVTTHTARRSCVTNLHLSGENLTNIMAVSGHTSQATLNLYLKMSAEDIAEKLKENSFFSI